MTTSTLFLLTLLLHTLHSPCFVSSFTSTSIRTQTTTRPTPTSKLTLTSTPTLTPRLSQSTSTSRSSTSTSLNASEFELQELRAQFNAMINQKVRPKMLTDDKKKEIESYVGNVLRNSPSPTPLKKLADDNAQALYGTWTLVYASEGNALGDLPRDTTVEISISPEYKCEYKLTFAKTFGLKSITAKSQYMVDASPVNPGLVTVIYQDIVSDVFGIKEFPVGLFGMLKGRATYVETVWFDGNLWIERGYSPEGMEFFNVYFKQ